MESFFASHGFWYLYITAGIIIALISFLFSFGFLKRSKTGLFLQTFVPSMLYQMEDAEKMLRRGVRLYYLYSAALNIALWAIIRFDVQTDLTFFVIPIMVQAALFLYVFQTYRRFFVLSPAVKNNIVLRIGFFFWLLFILLLGIEQIIRFPFFFGGLLMVLTGNENVIIPDSDIYSWSMTTFSLASGIIGEYLLRKIISKQAAVYPMDF